jgi:hypothetical protein
LARDEENFSSHRIKPRLDSLSGIRELKRVQEDGRNRDARTGGKRPREALVNVTAAGAHEKCDFPVFRAHLLFHRPSGWRMSPLLPPKTAKKNIKKGTHDE